MALTKDQIRTVDGKIYLIPAGTATEGARDASVSTNYAVTMSGASLSQSLLCPHTGTTSASSSYFYFRTADAHSVVVWYANDKKTTQQPVIGFSSSVKVTLKVGEEGNSIAYKTVKALDNHKSKVNRYSISGSGLFQTSGSNGFDYYEDAKLFINNIVPGAPPADAFNINNINASSFNYNVIQQGSGIAYGVATEGIAPTSSATTVIDGTRGYDGIVNTAEYTNIVITAANSSSYLTPFIASSVPYYNLDLSIEGAVFVRIDTNLLYPIGKITPRNAAYNKAQMLYIESANNGPHYLAKPSVASYVVTEVNVDSGDLVHKSFHERVIHGVTYPAAIKFDHGCRVMLIRGASDWKVQSVSDFTNMTASFDNISFDSINGGTF